MIDRVVVPVDFSEESDRAIAAAAALARRGDVDVELLSVVDPLRGSEVTALLAGLAEGVGTRCSWRTIPSGEAVAKVLSEELENDAKGLWCVGSHARGALGEALFGSSSEALVRATHVPVVLVGPHVASAPTGDVLAVALDGSAFSEAVLGPVGDVASALGMTVRLLQVGQPAELPPDVMETGYLTHVAQHMPSLGPVDYDVLHGHHPAEDLAEYVAAHREIAMIALSTHAPYGSARLRAGSTAFDLAHRATVPVMAVHHS